MISINKFTLPKHEGNYEDWPLKSVLYYDGKALNVKVRGFVIEEQFELPEYFLLLMNFDCPYEEACEVAVLNKQFKLVGTYIFSTFYGSYLFNQISERSKNCYEMMFHGPQYFELTINYPKKGLFSKVIKVKEIKA